MPLTGEALIRVTADTTGADAAFKRLGDGLRQADGATKKFSNELNINRDALGRVKTDIGSLGAGFTTAAGGMNKAALDLGKFNNQVRAGPELLGKVKVGLGQVGIALAAVTGAAVAAKKAFDFGYEGAQIERLESAGVRLARSFGQNMDDLASAIAEATNYAVPNMEAIGLASRALQLGVARTPEEFEKLTVAAAALGQAMGRTTSDALNDIITGVGRMSPLILDNIGILTKGGAVVAEYGASLGKTAEEMTDAEKKQALLNAALNSAAPLLDANGKLAADGATAYEQFNANLKDVADQAKRTVNQGLTPLMSAVSGAIQESAKMRRAIGDDTYYISGGWQGMKNNYQEVVSELERGRAIQEIFAIRDALDSIPRNISVTVTTRSTSYFSEQYTGASHNPYTDSNGYIWTWNGSKYVNSGKRSSQSIQQQKDIYGTGKASGGQLTGINLVGEEGPELVVGNTVIPAPQTRAMLMAGVKPSGRFAEGGGMGTLGTYTETQLTPALAPKPSSIVSKDISGLSSYSTSVFGGAIGSTSAAAAAAVAQSSAAAAAESAAVRVASTIPQAISAGISQQTAQQMQIQIASNAANNAELRAVRREIRTLSAQIVRSVRDAVAAL